MPKQLFTNNATAVLTVSVNTTFTTLTVDNGAVFPTPSAGDTFNLALIGLNVNGQEASWEVVQCTARSGNTLTVVRAQEGTTGIAWASGTKAELRLTSGFANTVASHVDSTSNPHGVTKAQLALGSVDNTSDADKPVSTAQATALGLKQNTLVSTTNIKSVNGTSLLGSGDLVIAAGAGDMVLATAQSVTGAKTFNTSALLMKGSSTGVTTFASANASATGYTITFPEATGTLLLSGGALGTPLSGVATNLTGTAAGLTAGVANGLKTATTTVSVSAATAPTAGQVLTATSTTAATWQAAAAGRLAKGTRATNTDLAVSDKGNLIFATASYTQYIGEAAILGAGWWCLLRVATGFATTLDANASELIDGQTTAVLQAGQTYLLTCTGTAFTLDRLGVGGFTQVLTSGTSWTCPGGVRTIKVIGTGGGGSGYMGASATSQNGGGGGAATFIANISVAPGTAYTYAIGTGGAAKAVNGDGNAGGSTTFVANGVTRTAPGGAGGAIADKAISVATNGDINLTTSHGASRGGNSSYWGGGGPEIVTTGPAPTASYGSGGARGGSTLNSGAGTAGVISIEY